MFVARSKERKAKCEEWIPKQFQQDLKTGQWVYKHSDLRPWDPRNDLYQFEYNYVIQTRTKHATPMIRTASIVSVEPQSVRLVKNLFDVNFLLCCSFFFQSETRSAKRKPATKQISSDADANDSATSEEFHSDSTQSVKKLPVTTNLK